MKKLFVCLLLAAGMFKAQAQEGDKKKFAQRMTDTMTLRLNLSGDQVPKVQTINEDFVAAAAGVKNSSGGKLAKLKKLKAADKDRDAAMKGVLTSEQYNQYLDQKKENREEAKKRYKELKKD